MADSRRNLLWPKLDSYDSAASAMQNGAVAAVITSLATAALVIAAIIAGHPIFGIDAWGSLDAVIFGVVAWRMFRQSLPWAIVGLVLFLAEKIMIIYDNGFQSSGVVLAIIFLLYYFHAVRAGFKMKSIRHLTPKGMLTETATPIE
jgi:hypothetical protein